MQEKQKIILSMEECQFSPGEYILKQGDRDDCSIYVIIKGQVSVVFCSNSKNKSDLNIKTLDKNDYFGEVSFITGQERSLSIKSNDFCRLYKIKRENFMDIIKGNTHDYEYFKMMEDSIKMYKNYKYNNIKCFSCSQYSHNTSECPKIHFKISEDVFFLNSIYSNPHQERKSFQRNSRIRVNSRNYISKCVYAIYEINNKYEFQSALNLLDQVIQSFYSQSEDDQEEYENNAQNLTERQDESQIKINNISINKNKKKQSLSTVMSRHTNQSNSNQVINTSFSDDQSSSSSKSSSQTSNFQLSGQNIQQKIKIPNVEKKKSNNQLSSFKRLDMQNEIYNKTDLPDVSSMLLPKNKSSDNNVFSNVFLEKQGISNRELQIDEKEGKSQYNNTKHSVSSISSQKQIKPLSKVTNFERKATLEPSHFKVTSILNENLEESIPNIQSYTNIREKSNQCIPQNNQEKEYTQKNRKLMRKNSPSLQNQYFDNVVSKQESNLITKLNQISRDSFGIFSQQQNQLNGARRTLDQNQITSSIEQFYQNQTNKIKKKQEQSQNIEQHLATEMKKVSQFIQNITEQKFENIMDIIKLNKSQNLTDPSQYDLNFHQKQLYISQEHLKGNDYEFLQMFECFKNYTYYFPYNNSTETIKLCNKFSYDKRNKKRIRNKNTSKVNKFFKQFNQFKSKI